MKSNWKIVVLVMVLLLLAVAVGCGKKPTTIARPPASSTDRTPPATETYSSPTIELSVSPSTIRRGGQASLSWSAANADSILIDGGVGNVSSSGSISVSPLESTTYTATATGRGGEAKASARVTVTRDEGRGEVVQTDLQALQTAIKDGLVRPIFFNYDSADLTPESRAILEENSKYFRRYPNVPVIIEGHCDERGTEEYNLALGDRRAQSAKAYLVQLGISADRLETISYGEERPFAMGSNEAAWAQNRRDQFVVR